LIIRHLRPQSLGFNATEYSQIGAFGNLSSFCSYGKGRYYTAVFALGAKEKPEKGRNFGSSGKWTCLHLVFEELFRQDPQQFTIDYLRVDRRLPELRKKLVFSVGRLFSRRCHNISSVYQSYSCLSQNRTSGFPIHTAPRLAIQYASVLRQGFRSLRMLPVGQAIQARA